MLLITRMMIISHWEEFRYFRVGTSVNGWVGCSSSTLHIRIMIKTCRLAFIRCIMREQTIMIDLLMVRNEGKLFIGTGCYSENFVGIAEQEITVADLLDMLMLGYAITYDDLRDSLYPVVKFDIKEYIDKLLCIDAITRNEDRHFRNISFIFKGGKYTPAKIYDNGAACFLDLLTYPMSMDIATCFQSVQALSLIHI